MEDIYEIGKEFYLIRSKESDFHRNIYLKRFIGKNSSINLLMDPGTKLDMEILSEALDKLIGGLDKIHLIFLSHQDPDVSSLTPFLISSSKAFVLTSQDTSRLIKMYGIPDNRIIPVESFKSESVQVKGTGHKIKFIPAYFCHFRGATMLYDIESKVLFSGDFMAGLNTIKGNPIYATQDAWKGISLFHSIYMPSNLALRETVARIGLLSPLPEVIAPQHGYVVKGDLVIEFLTRLSKLDVGIDLMTSQEPLIESVIMAINDFKDRIKAENPSLYSELLKRFSDPKNFTVPFQLKGDNVVQIKVSPSDVIRFILDEISARVDEKGFKKIKSIFLMSLEKFNVPYKSHWIHEEKEEVILLKNLE